MYLSLSPSTLAEEGEPRRKGTLYENLRLKNRENYEVTLNQKADTLLKASPEKEPGRYNKDGELLLQRRGKPNVKRFILKYI